MDEKKYIQQLSAKTQPESTDNFLLEDDVATKKIDFDSLAGSILDKLSLSVDDDENGNVSISINADS